MADSPLLRLAQVHNESKSFDIDDDTILTSAEHDDHQLDRTNTSTEKEFSFERPLNSSWPTDHEQQSPSRVIVQTPMDFIQRWFNYSFSKYHSSEYYSDIQLDDRFSFDSIVPTKFENLRETMFEKGHGQCFQDALEIGKKLLRLVGLTYPVNRSRFSPWPLDPIDLQLYQQKLRRILIDCAICSFCLGDTRQVIRYTSEAIELQPSQASAPLFFRATAFLEEDCFQLAFADYRRIDTTSLYYPSAKVFLEPSDESVEIDSTTAENIFEIYFQEKYPSMSYETEANALFNDGCYMLAILFYTHCIDSNSNIDYCLMKRAECYRNILEPNKLVEDCDRILLSQPDRIEALYMKARAYQMLGERKLSMEVLEQCLTIQPKNQILLEIYYSLVFRSIPRNKRRMRCSLFTESMDSEIEPFESSFEYDKFHLNDQYDSDRVEDWDQSMIERKIQSNFSEVNYQTVASFYAEVQSMLNGHENNPTFKTTFLKLASYVQKSLSKLPNFETLINQFSEHDFFNYSSVSSFLSINYPENGSPNDLPHPDVSTT